MRVIVIGAGLAGLSTAWFLREAGADVTVLERGAGPGLETSFANGSLLHPSLADPWNTPGILRFLLRDLGRESSPMLLRPHALPSLLGWGIRFIRESSPERHFANTLLNLHLANYSLEMMKRLRDAQAIDYHAYFRGVLVVHRTEAAHRAAITWFDRLAAHGLQVRQLDRAGILALEPAMAPIADQLLGGIHALRDEAGDPAAYCRSLLNTLIARGVTCHFGVTVTRWSRRGYNVSGVVDARGSDYDADAVVLAAASHSVPLVRLLGFDLPVRPVKGYSITIPRGASGTAPTIPVVDPALHMAAVPVGEDRIRVAGTAEFAGFDTRIQESRIANLRGLLAQLYPAYSATIEPASIQRWAGLRAMCSDGVPLIGETAIRGLYLNTGHGHLGWTLAAGSGRLAADRVLGIASEIDAAPYALARV